MKTIWLWPIVLLCVLWACAPATFTATPTTPLAASATPGFTVDVAADSGATSTVKPSLTATSTFTPTPTHKPSATATATPAKTSAPVPTPTFKPSFLPSLPPGAYIAYVRHDESTATDILGAFSLDGELKGEQALPAGYYFESAALAADGSRMIVLSSDSVINRKIFLLDLRTMAFSEKPAIADCGYFSWSPDGKSLLASCQGEINSILLADNSKIQLTDCTGPGINGGCSWPVWSPDGKWIAYYWYYLSLTAPPRAGFYVLNASCLPKPARCRQDTFKTQVANIINDYHPALWSPDSKTLALRADKDPLEFWFFSVTSMRIEHRQVVKGLDWVFQDFTWSPDGQSLILAEPYTGIHRVSPSNGQSVHISEMMPDSLYEVVIPTAQP